MPQLSSHVEHELNTGWELATLPAGAAVDPRTLAALAPNWLAAQVPATVVVHLDDEVPVVGLAAQQVRFHPPGLQQPGQFIDHRLWKAIGHRAAVMLLIQQLQRLCGKARAQLPRDRVRGGVQARDEPRRVEQVGQPIERA